MGWSGVAFSEKQDEAGVFSRSDWMNQQSKKKNFRKRNCHDTEDGGYGASSVTTKSEEEEEEHRMALEEVKLLQKQRERTAGMPAVPTVSTQTSTAAAGGGSDGGGVIRKSTDANNKIAGGGGDNKNASAGGEGEKDDLVLQDTFAQETAIMVEDPNMLKYIEQELAKKRGRTVEAVEGAENDLEQAEDELYKIPEHLKVKRRNCNESSTQWTTGIAEVQLPIEFKLKNIEETEAAEQLLQEKRFVGRLKSKFSIPSSIVLITSTVAGIMLKNLEEIIPSYTRIEVCNMMVLAPNQLILLAQMLQDKGRLPQMSSC